MTCALCLTGKGLTEAFLRIGVVCFFSFQLMLMK